MDQAVLPVAGVPVELPALRIGWQAVEVVEQVECHAGVGAAQLFDHGQRVDLLSGVERHAGEVVRAILSGGGAPALPGQPG